MIDWNTRQALTFDCYGTLVDWESGILSALRPILDAAGTPLDDESVLELYARLEPEVQNEPYRPYRAVLAGVVDRLGAELGFRPSDDDRAILAESIEHWDPFPDTIEALFALKRRFKLGILSNIDDDLFAGTARRLGIAFDWVVTAQQLGSYKPALANFEGALDRIGLPRESIVHVAQSLFHDVVPARSIGLSTVWVNRHGDRRGFGATPAAKARPDLEVPDLASLVTLIGL